MMFGYQHYEPFIFAIPQCPVEYTWGAFYYDEERRTYFLPRLDKSEEICITRAVYELTEYLTEKYSIDPDRRYLSGTSMGGAGVYELLYRHGDIFAGAIVGCTASDLYTARDIASVPMYIMHGTDDKVISVENSRQIVKILDEVGADFVYKEFAGRGHDFTAPETGDGEFCDAMRWMFSKKRKI
jgi:predicted peptidase